MKLREHTRQDHEIENDSTDDVTDDPKSPEIVYRCDFCNATESSVTALDHHVALHENQFKCVVCNKVLKHKGNLVLHMRIHVSKVFFFFKSCRFYGLNDLFFYRRTKSFSIVLNVVKRLYINHLFECICKRLIQTFEIKNVQNVH